MELQFHPGPDDGQRNFPKHVEFHAGVILRNWYFGWLYYKEFFFII
jgi:hypothetical protein